MTAPAATPAAPAATPAAPLRPRRPAAAGPRPSTGPAAAPTARRYRGRLAALVDDERGVYAPFIAIIAGALLFLGAIAYDGPRLNAARQHAVHEANEAARVAAATIASGGTIAQARDAAETRVDRTTLIYGHPIDVQELDCVGTRVQVTIESGYNFRSLIGLVQNPHPITATGAAEAFLVPPSDEISTLHYLGECPLT